MSGIWLTTAANAMILPLWNIGIAMLTSWMWPVPIHGSLVIITSPGFSVRAGNFLRKCLTVAGSVPMNDGMDSTDCAIEWPSASVSTTAKSFASRTSTENEVRTNAADASSTMLTRRFHWISSETGSSFIFFM